MESSTLVCEVLGQHCEVPGGGFPYAANCIGCAPPYHWETDEVGLECDGGTD